MARGPSAPLTTTLCQRFDTHSDGEVTLALAHGLLVSLPLVRPAGLGHVGGLLPPQTLTKLIHLRGHVLPGTADTQRASGVSTHDIDVPFLVTCSDVSHRILRQLGYF